MEELLGCTLSEMLCALGLEEEAEGIEALVREVLETGMPRRDVLVTLRSRYEPYAEVTGSVSWYRLNDARGRPLGVAAAIVDVTERYQARARLALLHRASTRIGTTLDVFQTARELADAAVPHFADTATVDLLDPVLRGEAPEPGPQIEGIALRRAGWHSMHDIKDSRIPMAGEISGFPAGSPYRQAMTDLCPRLISRLDADADWLADDPFRYRLLAAVQVRSMIVVPLRARGLVLGLACFYRWRSQDTYEDDDLALAAQLAAHTALCLDNARLYSRGRSAARILQMSVGPRSPDPQRRGDRTLLSALRLRRRLGRCHPPALRPGCSGGRHRRRRRYPRRSCHGRAESRHRRPGRSGSDTGRTSSAPARARHLAQRPGTPHPGSRTAHRDFGRHLHLRHLRPRHAALRPVRGGSPAAGLRPPRWHRAARRHPARTSARAGTTHLPDNGTRTARGQRPHPHQRHPTERLRAAEHHPDTGPGPGRLQVRHRITPGCLQHPHGHPAPQPPEPGAALLLAKTRALGHEQLASWTLQPAPEYVAQARKHAVDQLAAWSLDDLTPTTELVVSELVTNALRYSDGPIGLRLIRDRTLTCEVSDTSSTAPQLRRAEDNDEGGRGLFITGQLT